MELLSKSSFELGFFTVDKVLDLRAEAVKAPTGAPCCHYVTEEHLKTLDASKTDSNSSAKNEVCQASLDDSSCFIHDPLVFGLFLLLP